MLPKFAWLRADRSVYAHAARRVRDERLRMALSFHPLFIGGDPFHVTSMYAQPARDWSDTLHATLAGLKARDAARRDALKRGGSPAIPAE